jgi:hypothetical protein
VHCKYIPIYIQQDATLHSLFYPETALHVSGGTSTPRQERKQLYPQHLVFLSALRLPVAIAPGSSDGVTNTRCCTYSKRASLSIGALLGNLEGVRLRALLREKYTWILYN